MENWEPVKFISIQIKVAQNVGIVMTSPHASGSPVRRARVSHGDQLLNRAARHILARSQDPTHETEALVRRHGGTWRLIDLRKRR